MTVQQALSNADNASTPDMKKYWNEIAYGIQQSKVDCDCINYSDVQKCTKNCKIND